MRECFVDNFSSIFNSRAPLVSMQRSHRPLHIIRFQKYIRKTQSIDLDSQTFKRASFTIHQESQSMHYIQQGTI